MFEIQSIIINLKKKLVHFDHFLNFILMIVIER